MKNNVRHSKRSMECHRCWKRALKHGEELNLVLKAWQGPQKDQPAIVMVAVCHDQATFSTTVKSTQRYRVAPRLILDPRPGVSIVGATQTGDVAARGLHAMVIAAITGPDRLCSIGGKNDHVPFFTSKRSEVFKYSRPS
jgi:hypothetical protein